MTGKTPPLTREQLEAIAEKHPTPFYIYDEKSIRLTARRLLRAFEWNPGFKEYFAVKATPNPFILSILKQEGFGLDCSSLPELLLAESVGVVGEEIMFSSNDMPAAEFVKAAEFGATINHPNGAVIIIPARPFLHPVMEKYRDKIVENYREAIHSVLG